MLGANGPLRISILVIFGLATCVAGGATMPAERPEDLDPLEVEAYTPNDYKQPQWARRADSLKGTEQQVHERLQLAAQLHQDGELEKAVTTYKQVIKMDPNSGEAYASLSKCLADQGKMTLADKAMSKATRIHNEQLASWSLF